MDQGQFHRARFDQLFLRSPFCARAALLNKATKFITRGSVASCRRRLKFPSTLDNVITLSTSDNSQYKASSPIDNIQYLSAKTIDIDDSFNGFIAKFHCH